MVMYVGQTYSYDYPGHIRTITPKRPHRQYEFWSEGTQLSEAEGRQRVSSYFKANEALFADPSKWQQPVPRVVTSPGRK
jgi:hypothetical protein